MWDKNDDRLGEYQINIGEPLEIKISRNLQGLQTIMIKHIVGTLDVGSYNTNSIFTFFELELNGIEIMKSMAEEHLREINSFQFEGYVENEIWILSFMVPNNIPRWEGDLILKIHVAQNASDVSSGAATTYLGAKALVLLDKVTEPENQGMILCWERQQYLKSLGSSVNTEGQIQLKRNRLYRSFLLYIEDDGSADDEAIKGDIIVEVNGEEVYKMDYKLVQSYMHMIFDHNPQTGYFMLMFDNLIQSDSDKEVYVKLTTADTLTGEVKVTLIAQYLRDLAEFDT